MAAVRQRYNERPMRVSEVYLKTRKVPDLAWNLYVCRPAAAVLVRSLYPTRITPNQVTLFACLVALGAAAILIGVPGYLGLVIGIVVFELSYVLDCADGMLARLRGTASPVGHLLDFLMDEIKAFIILAAVSIRLFMERNDLRFLILGLVGLVALASGIALTTFVRRPELGGKPGPRPPRPGVGGLLEGLAKLVVHYPSYIWLAALLGRMELYLFPYIAVNGLYALGMWLALARRFGRFETLQSPENTRSSD